MGRLGGLANRKKVIRALERAGFHREQCTKHVVMYHEDGRHTTIPNANEIRTGTLRAMIKQAGLTVDEFERLYRG
jgi:predicted RNA binding protein YcfA (HicA-like mRNA interferase family)